MSTTHANDMGQRLLSTTAVKGGRRQQQESMTGVDGKGLQVSATTREDEPT